jgi:hypothetical protein
MGREIVYCGDCGQRLSEDDFDRGRARFIENRPFCTACRGEAPAPPPPPPRKQATERIPIVPQTPRRAMPISGSPPPPPHKEKSSRTPIVVGGLIAAAGLVLLVVAVGSGGTPERTSGPRTGPKEETAPDLLPSLQELEKLAASGAEPEAILARCDRLRGEFIGSRYADRFKKIEDKARESKSARDRTSHFQGYLTEIRKKIQADPEFAQRDSILPLLTKAKDVAGAQGGEVDKLLAEYNGAYAAWAASRPMAFAAEGATRKGPNLQLKGDYLGNWRSVDDSAEWALEVYKGGVYKIDLAYACAKDSGGDFFLTVGSSQLRATVDPTGGDWKKFKTIPLGAIALSPGKFTLTVKPLSVKGGGLLNLRTLTLTLQP